MKVTREQWIEIDFENGTRTAPARAKRIGQGRWTTAYLAANGRDVYLFTKVTDTSTDYGKEIMANMVPQGLTHLPQLEKLDDYEPGAIGTYYYVFASRYYAPLTAKSGTAWKQFKMLRKIAAEESARVPYTAKPWERGADVMAEVVARVRCHPDATSELANAVDALADGCQNYGQTWSFEFAKRNCAVDAEGNLVLLDCIYDMEQIAREQKKARSRRIA